MKSPIPHPRHPTHLLGSRWTRQGPHACVHFEVVEVNKRQGLLRLRAALRADVELLLPWRALRERHAWQPGWCSVVEPAPAPAPHEPVPPAPKRDASGDDVVGQSDPA